MYVNGRLKRFGIIAGSCKILKRSTMCHDYFIGTGSERPNSRKAHTRKAHTRKAHFIGVPERPTFGYQKGPFFSLRCSNRN